MAKKQVKESFEKNNDIKALSLYVTIVSKGQGDAIVTLLQKLGSNAQFVQYGNGTASKSVLDVLGIEENEKDVVFSFIKKELVKDVKNEVEAFFMANKRNKGIGFAVKLTSVIGVKIYKFLTNS